MSSSKPALDIHDFVKESKRKFPRLVCFKCSFLMSDAVQLSCGDRLCRACADEIFSNDSGCLETRNNVCPRCPKCREILQQVDGLKYNEDLIVQREVLNLVMKCPIHKCKWVGQLGRYEMHRKSYHAPYTASVEPSEMRCATHVMMGIDSSAARMENPTHLRRKLRDIKQTEKELTQEQKELRQQQDQVRLKEDDVRLKEDELREKGVELRRRKDEVRLRQNELRGKEDELKRKRQGMVFDGEDYANGIESYMESMNAVRITAPVQNDAGINARMTSSLGRAPTLTPNEKSSTLNADGPEMMARFEQEAELEYANTVDEGEGGGTMLVHGVGYRNMSYREENEPTHAYQESTPTHTLAAAVEHNQFPLDMSLPRTTRPPTNQSYTTSPPIYHSASATNQMRQPLTALMYSQIEQQGGYSQSFTAAAAASTSTRPPEQIFANLTSNMAGQMTASNSPTRYLPSTGAAAVNNRADALANSEASRENCPKCEVFKGVVLFLCETFSTFKNSNPRTFPKMPVVSPATSHCRQRENRHSY